MRKRLVFLGAAIALLIALGQLPYGYYQLLRWFICGVGAYGAFLALDKSRTAWAWVLGITALIFNPLVPFHFEKEFWQALDMVAAVIFFVYFVIREKPHKESHSGSSSGDK